MCCPPTLRTDAAVLLALLVVVHDEQRRPAHAPMNGRPSALEVIAPVSLSYMFTCTVVARSRLCCPLMLRTSQATMADDDLRMP